ELRAKLQRPELRQLQQRIELQCSLPPLSPEQTRDYIQTRLRVAGARVLDLFSDRAQTRIAKYSRGIPRRVNILCDHCLVIGYADQRRRIGVDVVDQAIAALDGPARRPARQTTSPVGAMRERWILGAVAAAVLAGVAVSPLRIEATQYRVLRHAVETLRKGVNLQIVAVTSAAVGDGKTITAINLAGALAQSADARVLLVDVDLRRPAVARHLGLGGSKGSLVGALL